jgi:hypothetical protein
MSGIFTTINPLRSKAAVGCQMNGALCTIANVDAFGCQTIQNRLLFVRGKLSIRGIRYVLAYCDAARTSALMLC